MVIFGVLPSACEFWSMKRVVGFLKHVGHWLVVRCDYCHQRFGWKDEHISVAGPRNQKVRFHIRCCDIRNGDIRNGWTKPTERPCRSPRKRCPGDGQL